MKRDSNHHASDETGTAFGKIITIASTMRNPLNSPKTSPKVLSVPDKPVDLTTFPRKKLIRLPISKVPTKSMPHAVISLSEGSAIRLLSRSEITSLKLTATKKADNQITIDIVSFKKPLTTLINPDTAIKHDINIST